MSDFKALAKEAHRMEVGFREAIGYDDGDADLARSVIADELARFTTALDTAADLLAALDAILHDPDFERAAEGGYIAGTLWEVALEAVAKATEGRTVLARAIPKEE